VGNDKKSRGKDRDKMVKPMGGTALLGNIYIDIK